MTLREELEKVAMEIEAVVLHERNVPSHAVSRSIIRQTTALRGLAAVARHEAEKPAEPAPVGSLLGLPDLAESLHGLAEVLENARPDAVRFVPFDLRTIADRLDGKSTAAPAPAEPAPAPAPMADVLEMRHRIHSFAVAMLAAAVPPEPLPMPEPLPHVIRFLRDLVQLPRFPMQAEAALLADRLAESVPGGAEEAGAIAELQSIAAYCEREVRRGRFLPRSPGEVSSYDGIARRIRNFLALSGAVASGEEEGTLEAVFAEVAAWARATFPGQTAVSIAEHLRREAQELVVNPTDPEELADVLMLAADLADLLGVNPAGIMARKLAECRTRKWSTPDAQGVHEHVRAAHPAPAPPAPPRRCIACGILNPGSDVCPATQSGKHVLEAETDSAETRSDHGNASLLDAADGARRWLLHMQEWVKQYDCPTHGELCGRWAENLRRAAERESDAPALASCPDVAELEEAIRKLVREEVAKLGRGGDEPSLFAPEDWRNLYAGLAMHALVTASRDDWSAPNDTSLATLAWRLGDLLSEPLRAGLSAPRPKPPEEHVAPDTSGTRRKP